MWASDKINVVAQCDSSPSERICVLLPREGTVIARVQEGGFLPRKGSRKGGVRAQEPP